MKDYLVFGTRFCGFGEIFNWIEDHCDAALIVTNSTIHKKENYDKRLTADHRYFKFNETSLVYHEELMLSRNTTNYTRTIIILRDLYDVVDDILSVTSKSTDKVIGNQIELFEEFVDEYMEESHKIPEGYALFINYSRWMFDINYRDEIALSLGFVNKDKKTYLENENTKLRNKMRYKQYFTSHVKELNTKVICDL